MTTGAVGHVWSGDRPMTDSHAAYAYLVQALFAYNRQWRSRGAPCNDDLVKVTVVASTLWGACGTECTTNDYHGYLARDDAATPFQDILYQLITDGNRRSESGLVKHLFGHYGKNQGAWNMDTWMVNHPPNALMRSDQRE